MKRLNILLAISLTLASCEIRTSNQRKSPESTDYEKFELARRYYSEDKFELALKLLEEIKVEGDSALLGEYYFKRGSCKMSLEQTQGALADFLKAADLKFKPEKCYHNMGLIYFAQMEDSMAIYYFEKALVLNRTNSFAAEAIEEIKKHQKLIRKTKEDDII